MAITPNAKPDNKMQTVKINKKNGAVLSAAINALAKNKAIQKVAEKAVDAAKVIIERELKSLRKIDFGTLPENETLIVEMESGQGLKIDRRGQDRIDIEMLRALYPDVAKAANKHTVATFISTL